MIEEGKYHDSLEELFTVQNIEELKVIIRYQVFTFDLGFKMSRDLTKRTVHGNFFIFRIQASLCNAALSH